MNWPQRIRVSAALCLFLFLFLLLVSTDIRNWPPGDIEN